MGTRREGRAPTTGGAGGAGVACFTGAGASLGGAAGVAGAVFLSSAAGGAAGLSAFFFSALPGTAHCGFLFGKRERD